MSTIKSGSCQTETCSEFGNVYSMDTEINGEILVCGECKEHIPLTPVND